MFVDAEDDPMAAKDALRLSCIVPASRSPDAVRPRDKLP